MDRCSQYRIYLLVSILVCVNAVCQQREDRVLDRGVHFTYRTFQVPGSSTTIAYGVNSHGDIVGYTDVGSSGFLYSAGAFQTIACPGVPFTVASAINDSGVIVGYCGDAAMTGFIYQNGAFIYAAYPGATSTLFFGVNNQGEVVGQYLTEKAPHFHAFVYSNGSFTLLAGALAANATNQSSAIAADGCFKQSCSGEIYSKGKNHWKRRERVMYPGAAVTILNGMNDAGDLAGFWASPRSATNQGFVYLKSRNKFASINVKKNETTEIFAINNSDEIVGCYAVGNNLYGFYGQLKP